MGLLAQGSGSIGGMVPKRSALQFCTNFGAHFDAILQH
jgi:hypothetical protein